MRSISLSPRPRVLRRMPVRVGRGFTLLEILVVLAIIGLLAGLAISKIDVIFGGAQSSVADTFVRQTLKNPLTAYRIHMGDYPSTAAGIQALITPPSGKTDRWHGPYIEGNKVPLDPWGQPYEYAYPGKHNKTGPDIWSKGPPTKPEEIGNWDAATGADAPK